MTVSSPVGLLREGLLSYLVSPDPFQGEGEVLSWVNPDHPGFVYPEAMGLYLRLISHVEAGPFGDRLKERAGQVAAALDRITPESGGVGMAGNTYLFDSCMVTGGLVAYRRHFQEDAYPELLERLGRFIKKMTQERLALVREDGSPADLPHHWSTVFGTHMLKNVIAMDSLAEETGDEEFRTMALDVAEEVLSTCLKKDAFRISASDTIAYCHAHCYSLEGLLYLRAKGLRDESDILRAGAEQLRRWQNPDGSMYNWHFAPDRERLKVGDASAQAVRVLIAVDSKSYETQIERGLSFLAGLKAPESGLYYCEGSEDVNSITSVFAAQAVDWRVNGPRPEWLV